MIAKLLSIKKDSYAKAVLYTALAVFVYMWQWQAMPLFPDEVAFMTRNARFFAEEGYIYGRFAVCPSSENLIPYIFYPAAILLDWVNSSTSWMQVRVLPYLSILALMLAALKYSRGSGRSVGGILLLSAGFVGVAGSGLVMSRPEVYLVFQGAVSLFVFACLDQGRVTRMQATGLMLLLALTSNFSVFVHPQGLLFVPITMILMIRLSAAFDGFARYFAGAVSSLYVVSTVWFGYQLTRFFRCAEHPEITDFIKAMMAPGWMQSDGMGTVSDRLREEFFARFGYFDRFDFASGFQIDYLPPVVLKGGALDFIIGPLNFGIMLLAVTIMAAFVWLCLSLLVRMWRESAGLIRSHSFGFSKLWTLAISNESMFFIICWAHLGLLLIVTQVNFYRAFYLNLAMVVMLFIAVHVASGDLFRKYARRIGMAALGICLASALVTNFYITPALQNGYAGPSIPLSSDWDKIGANVDRLKMSCDISDSASRIVTDDMTYVSLKAHRRVLPVTYIALSGAIIKAPVKEIIHDIGASSAIMRCEYFDAFKMPYQSQIDGLCCVRYPGVDLP
jgi:hypothetical protein